jgi:geranylgeranyl pyrophosphate synthase
MDNDIMRRNAPAFHIKNGIKYTYFFIYYLLNKTLLLLYNNELYKEIDMKMEIDKNATYFEYIAEIFKTNLIHLLDGQYIDMEYKTIKESSDIENTTKYLNNKLNALFSYNDTEESNTSSTEHNLLISDLIQSFMKSDNDNDLDNDLDNNPNNQKENIKKLNASIILNFKKTSSLFNISILSGLILQLWHNQYNFNHDMLFYLDLSNESINTDTSTTSTINNTNMLNISNNYFEIVAMWANVLGYIFQLSDDILDFDDDVKTHKANICIDIGINKEKGKKILNNASQWLNNMLNSITARSLAQWPQFALNTSLIGDIIQLIVSR